MTKLDQRWDLETIFPEGSSSPQLHQQLDRVRAEIAGLRQKVKVLTGLPVDELRALIKTCRTAGT